MSSPDDLTRALQDHLRASLRKWSEIGVVSGAVALSLLILNVLYPPNLPPLQVESLYVVFGILGVAFLAAPFGYRTRLRRRGVFYNHLVPRTKELVFPRTGGFPLAILDTGMIFQAYHVGGGRSTPVDGLMFTAYFGVDGSGMVPSAAERSEWARGHPFRRHLGTVAAKKGPPSLWGELDSLCRRLHCRTDGASLWARPPDAVPLPGAPRSCVYLRTFDPTWYAKGERLSGLVDELTELLSSVARADFSRAALAPA